MPELQLGVELPKKLKSIVSTKTIALVGQPNSGKSTLFNALSDVKVSTANFAGTTVEFKETNIEIYGELVHLIDLPGVYSLNPIEPAEFVTTNYILDNKPDLILNVIDSTLVTKSLELTVELLELGLPMVVVLNMNNEAIKKGIQIDETLLANIIGVPVVKISALYRKGINELLDAISLQLSDEKILPKYPKFTYHIEEWVKKIEKSIENIKEDKIYPRFFAIKILENPPLVTKYVTLLDKELIQEANKDISEHHKTSLFEVFAYERHHISMEISHRTIKYLSQSKLPFTEKIDLLFLKPLTGYFFAIVFFVLYFLIVFKLGNWLSELIEIPISYVGDEIISLKSLNPLLWALIDGLYQGLAGALGIVLPYFLPLLFLTAILEESGYMARIAFLMDTIFHLIGLHGKSVASFVMGFGCTVPAIYATRIIENRRDRLLASILINFIPCSARLTVIFALTTALTGPLWTVVIFAYVLLAIAITSKILSIFFPKPIGLIMEVPPLRLPSFSIVFRKTKFKLIEFFKFAFPFLLAGSIVLSLLDFVNLTEMINKLLEPFITGLLGLPEKLGSTLVFGFLRKELAVFMTSQAFGITELRLLPLSIPQVITFIIFIIFYLPCISTSAVLLKEFGWKHLLLTILIGLSLSTLSALIFKITLATFF